MLVVSDLEDVLLLDLFVVVILVALAALGQDRAEHIGPELANASAADCRARPTRPSARPMPWSTSRMRSGVATTTATTRPTHASSAVPAVLITARRISARCSPIAPPGPWPGDR